MTARTLLLALLLLPAIPAAAQAPKSLAAEEGAPRRRDFYLSPEAAEAARAAEAKMNAVQQKMDARVRKATRSICEGCAATPAGRRHALAAPRDDEAGPGDPAQAPID